MEFDEDIQQDLDERNAYSLACVAQDARNFLKYIAPRSMIAALKRKTKAEKNNDDCKE